MLMKLCHLAIIVLLFPFLISSLVINVPPNLNSTGNRISLRDAITAAVLSTVRTYPYATFRQIEASSIAPTTNPDRLTDVRLFFEGNYIHPIIVVEMTTTWGRWGAPRFFNDFWPMDDATLPYQLRLDIRDADALMKRRGFTGRYVALDVNAFSVQGRQPQPWWIFLMESDQPYAVWVGDRDGQVVPDWEILGGIKNRNGTLSAVK